MNTKIQKLIDTTRRSSFNLDSSSVTIRFKGFVDNVLMYTHYELSEGGNTLSNREWLEQSTPAFQRDNNKWTKKMKLKFIENILNGAKTDIMLFKIAGEGFNYQIIDGLQRTTAIIDFIEGEIKPFGFSYEDLKEDLFKFRTSISLRLYDFQSWDEVGKFYVDMNENITHSEEDIDIAKKWFKEEKGIEI